MKLPEKIKNLIDSVKKIPGIGEKTATRYALLLASWHTNDILSFSNSVKDLLNLNQCSECGMLSDQTICTICIDPLRSTSKCLCIVENISDCISVENGQHFLGLYHILGGVLNPLSGIGPAELKFDHLLQRIKTKEIEEIILAINPSVEGDATCSYIRDQVDKNVKVERIGFGIPMGGSLEYLDSLTIAKAIENRRPL